MNASEPSSTEELTALPDRDFQLRLRLLERLLESLPVAVALLDAERRFREVNPRYTAVVGKSREELIGQQVYTLWPNLRPPLEPLHDRTLRGEQTEARGLVFAFSDQPEQSRTVWNIRHTPLLGEEGAVESILMVVEEATETERHRGWEQALTEVSLAVSHTLELDQIFDTVYNAIRGPLDFDRCGLYIFDSPSRMRRIVGTDRKGRRDTSPSFFTIDRDNPELMEKRHHGLVEILAGTRDYDLVSQLDRGLPADHPMQGVHDADRAQHLGKAGEELAVAFPHSA